MIKETILYVSLYDDNGLILKCWGKHKPTDGFNGFKNYATYTRKPNTSFIKTTWINQGDENSCKFKKANNQ